MQGDDLAFAVSASDIRQLLARSVEQGMSVPRLLRDLSLDGSLLDDSAEPILLADCWRIMIANQNAVQEESHLMSSRPLKKGTTRLVFSNLRHCETVGEALQSVAETYNVIHGGDYNFVRKHGRSLSYMIDDTKFHYAGLPDNFAIEFALIRIHCALSVLAGHPLKILRMRSKRKILPSHNHHLNLFGCKCLTGQSVYELSYDATLLKRPLIHRNNIDVTGNLFEQFMNLRALQHVGSSQDKIVLKVKAALKNCAFRSQLPDQHDIAGRLNMSVATLRRKLTMANVSFQSLKDNVVCEYALNLLEDGLTTREISERLGYSDDRSFKRAFKRWQGITPAAFLHMRDQNNSMK